MRCGGAGMQASPHLVVAEDDEQAYGRRLQRERCEWQREPREAEHDKKAVREDDEAREQQHVNERHTHRLEHAAVRPADDHLLLAPHAAMSFPSTRVP
eukprot:5642206-Prymnesium_polylepis.2